MNAVLQAAVRKRLEIEARKAAEEAAFQEAAAPRWAALVANYRYVRAALEGVAGTEVMAVTQAADRDNRQEKLVERLPLLLGAKEEPGPDRRHRPYDHARFCLRLYCVSETVKYPPAYGGLAGRPAEWEFATVELEWRAGYMSDGRYDQAPNTFAPNVNCWSFSGSGSAQTSYYTQDGILKRLGERLAPYLPEDLDEIRRAAAERAAAAAAGRGGRAIDL